MAVVFKSVHRKCWTNLLQDVGFPALAMVFLVFDQTFVTSVQTFLSGNDQTFVALSMADMLKLFHQIVGLLLALAMKLLYPFLYGLDFFIIIVVIIKN